MSSLCLDGHITETGTYRELVSLPGRSTVMMILAHWYDLQKVQRENSRFRKLMAAQLNAAVEERGGPMGLDGSTRPQQLEDASEVTRSDTVVPTRTVF